MTQLLPQLYLPAIPVPTRAPIQEQILALILVPTLAPIPALIQVQTPALILVQTPALILVLIPVTPMSE